MKRRNVVISGINLFQGGPLKVYFDFLDGISNSTILNTYNIVIFVHNKNDFKKYEKTLEIIELPKSRNNYMYRLYYEYLYFYFYSKKRNIDIWISLHDISPNVKAKKRYVYCHSPIIFHPDVQKFSLKNWKLFLYAKLYKISYGINIKKNTDVIVQQNWMGKEFKNLYGVDNIIVARPTSSDKIINDNRGNKYIFFYPAFPRDFKNFELICEANKYIYNKVEKDYEIWLTIDGSENKYSQSIIKKYKDSPNVKFIGLKSFEEVWELYGKTNCLVFPSKLETWGLPISEFKNTNRPILAIDYPYAHETVGDYDCVAFFDNNPKELAKYMLELINGRDKLFKAHTPRQEFKTCNDWSALIKTIFDEAVM